MKKWLLFFCGAVLVIVVSSIMGRIAGNREGEALFTNFENTKQELEKAEMKGAAAGLKTTAEELNKKAPYAIDELTTFLRQEVDGLTLTTFFKLALDKTQIATHDIETFKEETIVQRCKIANLHDGYRGGIVSVYDYIDVNNEPFARIVIDEEVCSGSRR